MATDPLTSGAGSAGDPANARDSVERAAEPSNTAEPSNAAEPAADRHGPVLNIEKMAHAADLPLPSYQTPDAAGMDLRAALDAPVTLRPGERAALPTGLKMAIPSGFEGQVRPRSGLAMRSGIALVNAPGTIDADYRGEVKVLLVNLGQEPVDFRHGDRIAQLVIAPVTRVEPVEASPGGLDETARGDGGFGSTGVR